ncbi:MAG TPA: GlsB/YeaQ/YmgE family stress response membrane protein [Blastocatellia bacterium]|nr:GlsB/YeaQ/YmgE family stress response membrane protein [Blastocatellia bacterium]
MDLLGIIGWLVVGLIVGALARLVMPGRDEMGCLATALLGIAGGVVGGLLGSLLFGPPERGSYFRPGWILSLVGAVILLWLWRMMRRRA